MKFHRMIATNPEIKQPEEADLFVFIATRNDRQNERASPNTFYVKGISLQGNGWVFIVSHGDYPIQCFPSWRVVALEGPMSASKVELETADFETPVEVS